MPARRVATISPSATSASVTFVFPMSTASSMRGSYGCAASRRAAWTRRHRRRRSVARCPSMEPTERDSLRAVPGRDRRRRRLRAPLRRDEPAPRRRPGARGRRGRAAGGARPGRRVLDAATRGTGSTSRRSSMSALPDDPDHFRRWAGDRRGGVRRAAWTTGRYVRRRARRGRRGVAGVAAPRGRRGASGIDGGARRRARHARRRGGARRRRRRARDRRRDAGRSLPYLAALAGDDAGGRGSRGRPGALDAVGTARPSRSSAPSLTAIDLAGSILNRHPGDGRGAVAPRPPAAVARGPVAAATARARVHRRRVPRVRRPARRGGGAPPRRPATDWPRAVDSLRPISQALWMAMGDDLRREFLDDYRHDWEIHRHRIAAEIARDVDRVDRGGPAGGPRRRRSGRSSPTGDRLRIRADGGRAGRAGGLGGGPDHRRDRAQHGRGREPAARRGDRGRLAAPGPAGDRDRRRPGDRPRHRRGAAAPPLPVYAIGRAAQGRAVGDDRRARDPRAGRRASRRRILRGGGRRPSARRSGSRAGAGRRSGNCSLTPSASEIDSRTSRSAARTAISAVFRPAAEPRVGQLLGPRAGDVDERAVDRADHVGERDRRGLAGERPAAVRPAARLDDPGRGGGRPDGVDGRHGQGAGACG